MSMCWCCCDASAIAIVPFAAVATLTWSVMAWSGVASATEEMSADASRKVEATNDFMSTQQQLVLAKPQQSAAADAAAATSSVSHEVYMQLWTRRYFPGYSRAGDGVREIGTPVLTPAHLHSLDAVVEVSCFLYSPWCLDIESAALQSLNELSLAT